MRPTTIALLLWVDMSLERGWADESPRFALQAGLICHIGKLW